MDGETYKLALMFEWGGGCLWCRNSAARKKFDVGPLEERLGLSAHTLEKLELLTSWHDTALDWRYPTDPGPWRNRDYGAFDEAALKMVREVQGQLGQEFDVFYERLGEFTPHRPNRAGTSLAQRIGQFFGRAASKK